MDKITNGSIVKLIKNNDIDPKWLEIGDIGVVVNKAVDIFGVHVQWKKNDKTYFVIDDQVEKANINDCPFVIIERFADNGEHSHWELINKNTGIVEWSHS